VIQRDRTVLTLLPARPETVQLVRMNARRLANAFPRSIIFSVYLVDTRQRQNLLTRVM